MKSLTLKKDRNHGQEKEIEKLASKICDLEGVKEKLSIKLAKIRDEKDLTNLEMNKTRSSSDSTVNALSQELRQIKLDLEKTSGREKQVK